MKGLVIFSDNEAFVSNLLSAASVNELVMSIAVTPELWICGAGGFSTL